jgi:hypothetical protein
LLITVLLLDNEISEWGRAFLKKLIVARLYKKLAILYEVHSSIALFATVDH